MPEQSGLPRQTGKDPNKKHSACAVGRSGKHPLRKQMGTIFKRLYDI